MKGDEKSHKLPPIRVGNDISELSQYVFGGVGQKVGAGPVGVATSQNLFFRINLWSILTVFGGQYAEYFSAYCRIP